MRMLFHTLTLILVSLSVAGCESLKGNIAAGRYTEPEGRFSFQMPQFRMGGGQLREGYNETLDRGLVEISDNFGMTAVYFTHGPSSGLPTLSGDRKADLEVSITNYAMANVFVPRTGQAQVLQKEFVTLGGEQVLFAMVNIRRGSGARNMLTNEVFDAKVGALLFIRGEHVFVLSIQNNIRDSGYKSDVELMSMAKDYKKSLRNFYDSFRFK